MIALLSGVAVVGNLTEAMDLVAARPRLRAVTRDGDLVGAGWVSGGSDRKPSTLEITSDIDTARAELRAARIEAAAERFNVKTELTFDVKSGNNTKNFEVSAR